MVPKEFAHDLHVPLPFLPHRQMGTVREDRELRASDPSMNGPSDARGDLIILAARDQRGDLDRRKLIRDIPVPEGTLDRELAGSPHRPIDGYADFAQRPAQLARPGPKAADVAAVKSPPGPCTPRDGSSPPRFHAGRLSVWPNRAA